ncbi:unnamed protein product [Ceutorhynchus assimilis]|uniref:Uncharacterized protein n=1 Tax=Ceutorhynchus assimilis TaxID=467358 RepID=A0A9N9MDI4_9CUCU|nr:unnamed protein product [Ceutorhynchus assimilis]
MNSRPTRSSSKSEEDIENLISRVCSNFVSQLERKLDSKLEAFETKITSLCDSLKDVNLSLAKNSQVIDELAVKVDVVEQRSKRNTLRLCGFEENQEDDLKTVLKFFSDATLDSIQENEIPSPKSPSFESTNYKKSYFETTEEIDKSNVFASNTSIHQHFPEKVLTPLKNVASEDTSETNYPVLQEVNITNTFFGQRAKTSSFRNSGQSFHQEMIRINNEDNFDSDDSLKDPDFVDEWISDESEAEGMADENVEDYSAEEEEGHDNTEEQEEKNVDRQEEGANADEQENENNKTKKKMEKAY